MKTPYPIQFVEAADFIPIGAPAQRFEPGNSAMALLHCTHSSWGRKLLDGRRFRETKRKYTLHNERQMDFLY
jgi:hypothetical protein